MLNYRRHGSGPQLVMIHGLFGSLENLGAVSRLLQDDFSILNIDLPNHGRSGHIEDSSLKSFAYEVLALLDELEIGKAHFWGHSLGGKVAMEIALTQPQRVDRLLILDIAPVAYQARHDDVFAGLLAVDPPSLNKRSDADQILSSYVDELAVRSFLLKNLERDGEHFKWRMNLQSLKEGYASLIAANSEGVFEGPVLFLKGQESNYIQNDFRDEVLRRFPKARMKIVAKAGHWLHAEFPEQIVRISKTFLL